MEKDRDGFRLLALGALAFAAAFVLANKYLLSGDQDPALDPPTLIALGTVLFGLPLAIRELKRKTSWSLLIYLLIGIPAAHAVATLVATWASTQEWDAELGLPVPPLLVGLAGGFAGALVSLLLLFLLRLRAAGAGPATFAAALVALTWWGGVAGKLVDSSSAYEMAVLVYFPWQIILAFFLSRLLRPSPPKDAAASA
jgi:hypothetical protein